MPVRIDDDLRRTFHLSALRRQAKEIATPRQQHRHADIVESFAKARERLERSYRQQFDTRVEVARRRIIDKAASRRRWLTPMGTAEDRFNPADTLRQARREVRDAHERRRQRLDQIEERMLTDHIEQARRQNLIQGVATSQFRQATERRQAPERRHRPEG